MPIDTGKILKISDKQYFDLTGENPSDYTLTKLRVQVYTPLSIKSQFAEKVPDKTDVVVNYRISIMKYSVHANGTALIPKLNKGLEEK